jgi:uncharacterized OsmC-like protein
MIYIDKIVKANGKKEWIFWKDKMIDFINEIVAFVTRRRKDNDVKRIMHYYRDFFNICIHIKFKDTGSDAIIRFVKISITAFKNEKVKKEVRVIRFFR